MPAEQRAAGAGRGPAVSGQQTGAHRRQHFAHHTACRIQRGADRQRSDRPAAHHHCNPGRTLEGRDGRRRARTRRLRGSSSQPSGAGRVGRIMDAQAIKPVTAAFRDRLLAVFSVNKIAGPVFVGPLDDPNAAGAAAVLFLYRVAVNAELRNAEHQRAPLPPGTTPTLLSGGLPLDLYYLLTAGTPQTGGEIDALGTLGFAMQNINDLPNLVGSPVANETVRLTLDSVTSEEMGR